MRVIAQELAERLGQQVIVDNRPGAGATIGSEAVAKAAADGYTLLLASQTNAISATLYPKLGYDPIEDFAPISLLGREPGVLVVHPSLPVRTFQEFVTYVKAHPGQIDFASSGNGSGQHLFTALLCSMTGMKMNHVPYRGSGQATTDLARRPGAGIDCRDRRHGRAHPSREAAGARGNRCRALATASRGADSERVGSSRLRGLCVDGAARPQGHAGADHRHAASRAHGGARDAAKSRRYMASAGIEIVGSSPAAFGAFYRSERQLWARVIRETGATID